VAHSVRACLSFLASADELGNRHKNNCDWSKWGHWSECENGYQTRSKTCKCKQTPPPDYSNPDPVYPDPVDPDPDYPDPDYTIDTDYPTDTRRNYGNGNRDKCELGEEKVETRACCSWSEWTEFSECSKDCDGGIKIRTRDCICGDDNDGGYKRSISGRQNRKCKGRSKEELPCNEIPCCNWGEFCEWSECDAPCGGVSRRYAKCECTPQDNDYLKRDGGHGFQGDHYQTETDYPTDYPIDYHECTGEQPFEEKECPPCYL
jgi:hypothetical protein